MNIPCHILFATRSLPFHSLGGMEVVTWDLARAFAQQGVKVTILTTFCKGLPEYSSIDGVNIHCLNAPSGIYSRTWWRVSRQVYRDVYSQSVDVVMSVSAGAMSMAKEQRGCMPIFVAQAHGTSWGEFISKIQQRSLLATLKSVRNLLAMFQDIRYRPFDAFIAIGNIVHNDLSRQPTRSVIGKLPIYTISNGVDQNLFEFNAYDRKSMRDELGISDEAKVIISVSRLHPQKGLSEGIEAFAAASEQDTKLHYIIVGNGPDEARLRAIAATLGVAERVHFAGRVQRDQLKLFLSAADIFLFTTKRVEGLPMNVLEALAAGLPNITSRHVADPRFRSIVIDPNDHSALTKSILAAQPSKDRSSILPLEFTLTHSAKSYIELFSTLLGQHRKRSIENQRLLARARDINAL